MNLNEEGSIFWMSTCIHISSEEKGEGGSLFLKLLRNIPSCYFLSAFEFALPPVPFIGVGWKDVEFTHYILRGHSPCTCSFLLLKISHKGIECEEESSQLFPRLRFPQSLEFSYTIGYAIWYPAEVQHPPRLFPRLGACHPPASCFMTKKPVSVLILGGYLPLRGKQCCLGSSKRERTVPWNWHLWKIPASDTKAKNFPNSTGRATKKKKNKVENNLSLQCRCVGKTFHSAFMFLLVLNAKKKEAERKEGRK